MWRTWLNYNIASELCCRFFLHFKFDETKNEDSFDVLRLWWKCMHVGEWALDLIIKTNNFISSAIGCDFNTKKKSILFAEWFGRRNFILLTFCYLIAGSSVYCALVYPFKVHTISVYIFCIVFKSAKGHHKNLNSNENKIENCLSFSHMKCKLRRVLGLYSHCISISIVILFHKSLSFYFALLCVWYFFLSARNLFQNVRLFNVLLCLRSSLSILKMCHVYQLSIQQFHKRKCKERKGKKWQ